MERCCLLTHSNLSLLQFKWSRKGFMRTRWIIHNQYVLPTDLTNQSRSDQNCFRFWFFIDLSSYGKNAPDNRY